MKHLFVEMSSKTQPLPSFPSLQEIYDARRVSTACFVAVLQTRWNSAVQEADLTNKLKALYFGCYSSTADCSWHEGAGGLQRGQSSLLLSPVPATSSRSSSAVCVRRAHSVRFGLPQGWTSSPHPTNADTEPNSCTLGFCMQVSAMK